MSIPDPGPLEAYMTPHESVCFLHRDYGMVGLGQIARFSTDSPSAADVWWDALCAEVEHETEMPGLEGTGPVAFGSFVFDPDRSSSRSVMILPRTIIGRWPGYCWLTQISYDTVDEEPPRPQTVPHPPRSITLTDGVISADRWRDVARQALELMNPGGLEQLVLMRDLEARTSSPVDPRWVVEVLHRRFPDSYTYLVEGSVGVTSKLTAGVSGGLVTSRVLTHMPGIDPGRAAMWSVILGQGPLAERHAATVEDAAARLRPRCDSVHVPECPGFVVSEDSTYLVTDVTGVRSHDEESSLSLVAELSPTAFVTGLPVHRAASTLAEVEEVDRGRVSGPTGWIDSLGNGQWLTDSRGGQIDATEPNVVHMFSGQPIGWADDPDQVAAEAEHRINWLRRILE